MKLVEFWIFSVASDCQKASLNKVTKYSDYGFFLGDHPTWEKFAEWKIKIRAETRTRQNKQSIWIKCVKMSRIFLKSTNHSKYHLMQNTKGGAYHSNFERCLTKLGIDFWENKFTKQREKMLNHTNLMFLKINATTRNIAWKNFQ